MSMNALIAATTVDFDDSLARDPRLNIGVDAKSIYRLNAEIAFNKYKESKLIPEVFSKLSERHGIFLDSNDVLSSDKISKSVLSEKQIGAFEKLNELACKNNKSLQKSIERSFVEDGRGVPAIALLILLVIVVVAVVAEKGVDQVA